MRLTVWYVFLLTLLTGGYLSFEFGYIHHLLEADKSMLSVGILALFFVMYLKLGYLIYSKNTTQHSLSVGYEASGHLTSLGMLGTVIGFIITISGMGNLDFSDPAAVKVMFNVIVSGLGTALYTTAVGLTSAMILRTCYYLTGRSK